MKALAFLILLFSVSVQAFSIRGNGTITEIEQEAVDATPHGWFQGSKMLPVEDCYFREGKAVNKGWCVADGLLVKVTEGRHAVGKRWRKPDHEIVYLPTQNDIWKECGRLKLGKEVQGCTVGFTGKNGTVAYLVFLPESDKRSSRIKEHELEYHIFRDIENCTDIPRKITRVSR